VEVWRSGRLLDEEGGEDYDLDGGGRDAGAGLVDDVH
jgi:hypothetical protein